MWVWVIMINRFESSEATHMINFSGGQIYRGLWNKLWPIPGSDQDNLLAPWIICLAPNPRLPDLFQSVYPQKKSSNQAIWEIIVIKRSFRKRARKTFTENTIWFQDTNRQRIKSLPMFFQLLKPLRENKPMWFVSIASHAYHWHGVAWHGIIGMKNCLFGRILLKNIFGVASKAKNKETLVGSDCQKKTSLIKKTGFLFWGVQKDKQVFLCCPQEKPPKFLLQTFQLFTTNFLRNNVPKKTPRCFMTKNGE